MTVRPARRGSRPALAAGLTAVVAVAGAVVAGCSGSDGSGATTTTTRPPPAVTYVNLGSTEAKGGSPARPLAPDTWPRILLDTELPRRTVFVDLALDAATVAQALEFQAPLLAGFDPTVATVWFGSGDADAGTPLDEFEDDLENLVEKVQATEAQVVVVLGAPPTDGSMDTTPYSQRAEQVARAAGVTLVDLRDFPLTEKSQDQVAQAIAEAVDPID